MSIPSNLYAEKVFAEHPIALWPLDDQVDYISLIDDSQRNFSNTNTWQISGGTCELEESLASPVSNNNVFKFNTNGTDVDIEAEGLVTGYLSQTKKSISIGFYAYEEVDLSVRGKSVDSFTISLGYDEPGKPYFENSSSISTTVDSKSANIWHHYSATFEIPEDDVLDIDSISVLVPDTPTNFELDAHGLSNNDRLFLNTTGFLPEGIFENKIYYVVVVDENNFGISEDPDGNPIVGTSGATGEVTATLVKSFDINITANLSGESSTVFYLSSFSVGQWSEEFHQFSLGNSLGEIPNIDLGDQYSGISSSSYGLSDFKAYYLANNNELLAKNINMPMVYGSRNVTSVSTDPHNGPSMIFPGSGVLNAGGQFRNYTVEMWLRINAHTFSAKRIFGPIASEDGLYVDGPFMTLKVGDNLASHYVGEMYRPMLLNIIFYSEGAALVINGEKVLDLLYSPASLSLPQNISSEGYEQDWLGIYSYDDIEKLEVDCFAIYPYQVPTSVSKRRYAYGQALDFPENITSAFNGKSFVADYTFANYSNAYVYPDIGQWRRGSLENMNIGRNVLAPPSYELPDLVFSNKDQSAWYSVLNKTYANSITLRPDASWNNTDGYVYFRSINHNEQNTKALYGVFEAGIGYEGNQTLFVLENATNKNYLKAKLAEKTYSVSSLGSSIISSPSHGLKDNDIISFFGDIPGQIVEKKEYFVINSTRDGFEICESLGGDPIDLSAKNFFARAYQIEYSLKYGSDNEYVFYQTRAITLGTTFVAGIDLDSFANFFGGRVASFIKSKGNLSAYFGGNREFTDTFLGYIYRIGFSTKRNLSKLSYLFGDNGTAFLRYQFDGGTDLSENYSPTQIVDAGGAYENFIEDILSHKASYTLFVASQFGRLSLDIATSSSWEDYLPLQYFAKTTRNQFNQEKYDLSFLQFNVDYPVPNNFDNGNYNCERSFAKTYISFQYIENGANKLESDFSIIEPLPMSKVVLPGPNWESTKYEVIDGAIIYPPPGIDIEKIAIAMYVDMEVEGIRNRPVRVKKLSLTSKSLNAIASNRIGSRLGSSVYPLVEFGFYQDLDGYNPFSIYADNTPYLYLTKSSGLKMQGSFPSPTKRSLAMRINSERKDLYSLAAVQLSLYFDNIGDLSQDQILFEIDGRVENYLVKARSIDAQDRRILLYATDSNDQKIETVGFYLNGRPSFSPVLTAKEWNMLGMAFVNPVDMSRRPGQIKILAPVLFNNLSSYALNRVQEAQRVPGSPPFLEYSEDNFIGVNMERLYNIYTGTNKVMAGDNISINAQDYQYSVYQDLSVQPLTIKAV